MAGKVRRKLTTVRFQQPVFVSGQSRIIWIKNKLRGKELADIGMSYSQTEVMKEFCFKSINGMKNTF